MDSLTERTWALGTGLLVLRQGDLTTAVTDAIVNAANSSLMGGGGVDGAIHKAAGHHLLLACKQIVLRDGPLPAGRAVITPGFRLSARHVIHTVGPIWQGGTNGEEKLLRSAYEQSLELAERNSLSTIAFPALSCGAYGYPLELAAPVALGALRRGLELGMVKRIELWLHAQSAYDFWTASADALFGSRF